MNYQLFHPIYIVHSINNLTRMLLLVIAVCATFASSFARPEPPIQRAQDGNTPIPIVNQSGETKEDGSFNYSYETGNGIKVEEGGYTKPNPNPQVQGRSGAQQGQDEEDNNVIQVLQGTFSYTAPDGQIITVRYIADENGFQPEGDHLPTAPPVPEDIARSLQGQEQQPGAVHSQ